MKKTSKQIRIETETKFWNKKALMYKYYGRCAHCGDKVNEIHNDPKQATIDHVKPRVLGGKDVFSNMQLLCAACNHLKDCI